MSRLVLRLLGGLAVSRPDGQAAVLPTRKAHALLVYLVLHPGRLLPRDRLVGLLWGDRGERQARHSLSQTLFSIRRALGPGLDGLVRSEGDAVGLDESGLDVDALRFERLAAARQPATLDEAAALYAGDLLDGFVLPEDAFMDWLLPERERLRELARATFAALVEREAEAGRADEAAAAAARLLALDPADERTHRRLMRLHLDRGDPDAALRQFRACTDALARHLRLEVGAETRALREEALRRRGEPAPRPAPTAVAADGAASARPAAGERKKATVLCVVADPSDQLGLDPEEADTRLGPALDAVREAITRHGGVLYDAGDDLGDRVVALFGVPLAQEDHGARACRAALAALEAARSHAVRLAAGLDSGEVLLRPSEAGRGGVVGGPVPGATRLARAAPAGRAAASAATCALAARAVRFEALAPLPTADGEATAAAFAVAGLVPIGPGLVLESARDLTRLVGRERELEALAAALEPARRGHGQLVAVVGDPGVGKSRLLFEFTRRGLPEGWRALAACADPQRQDVPFSTVAALVRQALALGEAEDPATLRDRVTSAVLGLEPALPALLALVGADPGDPGWAALEPARRRRRIADAVRALLARESEAHPLLLAIEDLHWLDAGSAHVLEGLVDGLASVRQLLLVDYRPEFRHAWSARSVYRQIRLDPLPPPGAEALLASLVGDDASLARLREVLVERTAGNPFFLEECVRALVGTGTLAGSRGAYRLVGAVDAEAIPDTVQAVIAARLDRLPAPDKHVLRTASAIGAETPHHLLRAVADLSDADLDAALDRLAAEEFLVRTRILPEARYAFKHALTHDVAYASLPQARRRALHGRVVAALEAAHGPRLAEVIEPLAHHAVRGEVWDRAVEYNRQAGRRAVAASDNRAAVAYFGEALAALERLPTTEGRMREEIDLRFEMRDALFVLGEHAAVPAQVERAEALAERLGDPLTVGRARLHAGGALWQQGAHRRALGAFADALAVARQEGDWQLEALASYRLGIAHHALGEYREAVSCFERAMGDLERRDAVALFGLGGLPYVFCCSFGAWALAELGEFARAERLATTGWAIATRLGHAYTQSTMLFGYGHVLVRQRRFAEARAFLEAGLDLYRVTDVPASYVLTASQLGFVRVAQGDVEAGLALLEQTIDPEVRSHNVQYAYPFLWMAEANLLLGRHEPARAAAARALAIAQAQEERGHEAWSRRLLAEGLAAAAPAEAEAHLAAALELARAAGLDPEVARGLTARAKLLGGRRSRRS